MARQIAFTRELVTQSRYFFAEERNDVFHAEHECDSAATLHTNENSAFNSVIIHRKICLTWPQWSRCTSTDDLGECTSNLPCLLQIEDSGKGQQIKIEKRGFPDAVLWNPWIAKSKGMADFGDEEYKVLPKLQATATKQLHSSSSAYIYSSKRPMCKASLRNFVFASMLAWSVCLAFWRCR